MASIVGSSLEIIGDNKVRSIGAVIVANAIVAKRLPLWVDVKKINIKATKKSVESRSALLSVCV